MIVGLVTTSFPRFPGDYAGCFVADRAATLAAEGHRVAVLAAGDSPEARAPSRPARAPSPNFLPAGVTVERLSAGGALFVERLPAGGALFYGAGAPEALDRGDPVTWAAAARFSLALAAAVRAGAPHWDAIEAHWLVPCALASLSGAPGRPLRAFAHSGDVALLERLPLGRTLARLIAAGAGDLRFVTDELRQRFAALAGREVGTVDALPVPKTFARRGPGPDATLRRQLALGSPTVLAVGRLVPIKGHDRLLAACARAGGAPELVILGDGPERPRLERLARELGVRLRLPGFVARAEVARWLAAADLYVQPSVRLATGRGEGAPMAVAEARAVGIPVLVDSDPGRLAVAIRALASPRNPIVASV